MKLPRLGAGAVVLPSASAELRKEKFRVWGQGF